MALCTFPPVASRALTFCDAFMKPISCNCWSCVWKRSSGERVSATGDSVPKPRPPANICCKRAGLKKGLGAPGALGVPVPIPPALNRFGNGIPYCPKFVTKERLKETSRAECSYSGQVRLVAGMTCCPKGKAPQAPGQLVVT